MILQKARNRVRKLGTSWSRSRRLAAQGNIGAFRQVAEIFLLRYKNGLPPEHYFAAGLYRPNLRWRDKREHLGRHVYLRSLDRLNHTSYRILVANKLVTNGLLTTFGVPTPRTYGVVGANGQTCDGFPLRTVEHLEALLGRLEVPGVCFKLLGGWSGRGFQKVLIERPNGSVRLVVEPGNQTMGVREFWTEKLDQARLAYVCQGLIEQHPEVSTINPRSVNTARVWMYQLELGRWEMYDAILRMGVGSSPVDNTCAGGIAAHIDISTGRLGAAVAAAGDHVVYESHPTTGARIQGTVLPMWREICELAPRACAVLPYMRLLGLDVALSTSGPQIIEMEAEPDAIHQIAFDHGVRELVERLGRAGTLPWRV